MRLTVRSRVNFDLHASLLQSKHTIASQVDYNPSPPKLGPHNPIKEARLSHTLSKHNSTASTHQKNKKVALFAGVACRSESSREICRPSFAKRTPSGRPRHYYRKLNLAGSLSFRTSILPKHNLLHCCCLLPSISPCSFPDCALPRRCLSEAPQSKNKKTKKKRFIILLDLFATFQPICFLALRKKSGRTSAE